jgi:hypothetical protein
MRFCTGCGAPLDIDARFCEQCGYAVSASRKATLRQEEGAAPERVTGILPFVFSGPFFSPEYQTLVLTGRQLLFIPCNLENDPAMAEARTGLEDEVAGLEKVSEERAHFNRKDWSSGPWQRYSGMSPADILAEGPGTIAVPYDTVTELEIVNDYEFSTDDLLILRAKGEIREWTAEFAQGTRLFTLLEPVLAGRIAMDEESDENA